MIFSKVSFLRDIISNKKIIYIFVLVLIGMILEITSLGVIFPIINLITEPESIIKYTNSSFIINFLNHTSKFNLLAYGLFLLILIYIFKTIFLFYSIWYQNKFTSKISADISKKMYEGYLNLPYEFHLNRNSSHLARNVQSEVELFTGLTQAVIFLVSELSVIVGLAFLLISIEPEGAIFLIIFLGFLGYSFHKISKKYLKKWGEKRQFYSGEIRKNIMQGFGGIKDVKIFSKESYFLNQFNHDNKIYTSVQAKYSTIYQSPRLYLELLAIIGLSGLLFVMNLSGKSIESTIPSLGIFVASAFRMIPSINRIIASFQTFSFSKPVIDLLINEFKLFNNNDYINHGLKKFHFTNNIIIKNLTFSYNGTNINILKDISLTIEKGETIGIIGESGSGKSTLVDILLGLLDFKNGEILIDSIRFDTLKKSWQNEIGYVPQSIFLLDDTIKKNIAFGINENEIDNKRVIQVIKLAELDDFVNNQPNGIESNVGERGAKLSGGQRQRIGIARALYNNPEILILDEATSALDNETELNIMTSIYKLKGKITIIIIAHRLSTLTNCDNIYRIKNGSAILANLN